jgi:hypothetical protein
MFGRLIGLCLLCLTLLAAQAYAQSPTPLSAEETVLRDINVYRKNQGVIYLARNAILDRVATAYVNYLSSVPPASLSSVNRFLANGQSIDDLLRSEGYLPYSDGYTVDFIPWPSSTITADKLIDYFQADARSGTRSVQSRKMSLKQTNLLPLSETIYREIGIGYTFNEESKVYIYVIIFASQPDVLPITITTKDAPNIISSTTTPEITLRIQNEYSHSYGDTFGDTRYIGTAKTMRISEQEPVDQLCPQPNEVSEEDETTPPHWERYKNRRNITLSAGFGPKTIYVELCDTAGIKVISQASVLYTATEATGEAGATAVSEENVLKIVQATQTAAANATANAPLMETVQAILTATASAP